MLERKDLIALAKATAKASMNPSMSFAFEGKNLTFEALNETFRKEINELAGGSYREYQRNKDLIFELIEVGINEVLPARVLQNYGVFADVKRVAQGDKPIFSARFSEFSKARAKKNFVTRVGLAGRYEVFKLDGISFEVPTSAWGGAAQIGFEEFLDGRIQMSDVYDIVLEGMDEAVYREIARAFVAMAADLDDIHKETDTEFVEEKMDRLLATADAYGKAAIYCTFEFAATMIPDAEWASDRMKQVRWDVGYYSRYKGHDVIILPQSFEDTTDAVKVIDPSRALIIPVGSEKPIKVAFEGEAAVREVPSQEDWSHEIQTYQKFGVAAYNVHPAVCVYINSALDINNTPLSE